MARRKTGAKKTRSSVNRIRKPKVLSQVDTDIEKYSIGELLELNNIRPLKAVAFLDYYGLTDQITKEVENNGEGVIKFSKGEFDDMYERYNNRRI